MLCYDVNKVDGDKSFGFGKAVILVIVMVIIFNNYS